MAQGKAMKIIMLVVIVCVLLAVLLVWKKPHWLPGGVCLLYTSDAADE